MGFGKRGLRFEMFNHLTKPTAEGIAAFWRWKETEKTEFNPYALDEIEARHQWFGGWRLAMRHAFQRGNPG